MKTTFLFAASMMSGTLGVLLGTGGADVYQGVTQSTLQNYKVRAMVVKELAVNSENTTISQQVYAVGSPSINATWGAKILRGKRLICSGGGRSTYDSESTGGPKKFNPRDWTGDYSPDCPMKLAEGDILTATWEHTDGAGYVRSVTVRTTVE